MKWKLINEPLGAVVPSGIQKKEIPLAVPLVMAGASVLSSMWGANKSKEAADEAAAKLAAQKAETDNERRLMKNRSWTDTASGQNTLSELRASRDREIARLTGAAKVGGATDAAVARGKELINDEEGKIISQATANFEDKKDAQDATYRADLARLTQQEIAADQQKSLADAQVGGAVSSALMNGALSTFQGTKLGQQMMGVGSPGGGGVAAPSDLQKYFTSLQTEKSLDWMRNNAKLSGIARTQLNLMGQ